MKLLILGATGPSGIQTCYYALRAGHQLVIYARNPSKLPADIAKHDDVQVIQGELTDRVALSSALEGCNAVLSALGPIEMRRTDTPIASAHALLIDLMRAQGVKRLITLGTPSIVDPADPRGFLAWILVGLVKIIAPGGYKDIITLGNVVASADDIEWTIVRVPTLLSGPADETVKGYVGDGKVGWFLNRAGFGRFMVEELEKREWIKRRPTLSSV
ncbi:hypothetical protein FRC07_001250 [Ceratobasidium sp. 392]|nr:hypothetical protein FRC07_001250 [Ceratobasidium sp. 392]